MSMHSTLNLEIFSRTKLLMFWIPRRKGRKTIIRVGVINFEVPKPIQYSHNASTLQMDRHTNNSW